MQKVYKVIWRIDNSIRYGQVILDSLEITKALLHKLNQTRGGGWVRIYYVPDDFNTHLIFTYPHSHWFNNIPDLDKVG